MKLLNDDEIACRIDHGSYSQYVIYSPLGDLNEDGMLYGPGIQSIVIHPQVEYSTYENYNIGDAGWERLFKSSKYDTGYGISTGVGVEDNQLILFNSYNKFSIFRALHAQRNFRKYAVHMLGIGYLDMILRFRSKTAVDSHLSSVVIPWSNKWHEFGLSPIPNKLYNNDKEDDFDFHTYTVFVDPKKAVKIDEGRLVAVYNTFKYELSKLGKNPPTTQSIWSWLREKEKPLDTSTIICDNQMVLF